MRTEVTQIIRGGLAGDKDKVLAYAKLLADNLEKEGNDKSARMVRRTFDPDAPKGNTVCFDDETSLIDVLDDHEGLEWNPELEQWFDPKQPSDSPYDPNW